MVFAAVRPPSSKPSEMVSRSMEWFRFMVVMVLEDDMVFTSVTFSPFWTNVLRIEALGLCGLVLDME